MRRKVSWMALGILGLSVLICGGGCTAEAQSPGGGAQGAQSQAAAPEGTGTARGGQAGGQALARDEAAALWETVGGLRAEVARLRQEVARLRTQVADSGVGGAGSAGTAQQGTGGAGTAGTDTPTGAQAGTAAPSGTGAVSGVPPAGSNVPSPQGTAVVDAVYMGVVRSASAEQVVIDVGDGEPVTLGVSTRTRVLRDGRSIGVRQLKKGEQVRAVVDLVGQEQTLEIAVLPAAPGE